MIEYTTDTSGSEEIKSLIAGHACALPTARTSTKVKMPFS
jgi:hypothetical protein